MFCPKCGEKNLDGAKFCAACGASFGDRAAPASAPTPVPPPARRPRRRWAVLVAVLAPIVVLLAVGAGVWITFFSPFDIDERTFPDQALRAVVASSYDADHDGRLSRDEGRAVTSMELCGAASLSGLGRFFPNVTALEVTGGTLASIDVSDLPGLTRLSCADEPLAELDVSGNERLCELSVPTQTQVTGLDATPLSEVWLMDEVTESYDYGYAITYAAERDDQGRVTAFSTDAVDASMRIEYAYDEQGRLAQRTDYTNIVYGSGGSTYTTMYAYDEQGRLAAEESHDRMYARYYTYDEAGRVATTAVGGVGDVTTTTTYTYDEAGRLASKSEQYKGQEPYETRYVYDDEGRCVQRVSGSSGRTEQTDYVLDGAGNVVHVESSGWAESLAESSGPADFEYDGEGRMTSASSTLRGITYQATISYDDAGNVAQAQTTMSPSGTVVTYTPTYERVFVAEGQEPPAGGLAIEVPLAPLQAAQHESLVDVWAVPGIAPAPEPYAVDGESLVMLY